MMLDLEPGRRTNMKVHYLWVSAVDEQPVCGTRRALFTSRNPFRVTCKHCVKLMSMRDVIAIDLDPGEVVYTRTEGGKLTFEAEGLPS